MTPCDEFSDLKGCDCLFREFCNLSFAARTYYRVSLTQTKCLLSPSLQALPRLSIRSPSLAGAISSPRPSRLRSHSTQGQRRQGHLCWDHPYCGSRESQECSEVELQCEA